MEFKKYAKKLTSPSIIAIVLGLICFLFQIMVPDVVLSAFQHIANINTPFAMLIAGLLLVKQILKVNYKL